MGCVILAGERTAELRSWKAFGQWVTMIRRASPKTPSPENALYAARKIVAFIQGAAALSKRKSRHCSVGANVKKKVLVPEMGSDVVLLPNKSGHGDTHFKGAGHFNVSQI